jgi:hypothetical protein
MEKDYNIINILINSYKKSKIPIPQNRNIMPKNKITYNFHKDADIFYKESIVVSAKIDKNENLDEIISPTFTYDKTKLLYQVCIEKESGIPYSVNLVKKDFITYDEKKDKKLCIQLLHEIVNEQYLIITIENDNTVNQSLYPNLSTAESEFRKISKEKTDNNWDDVKNNKSNFKNDYMKYYVFDYSFDEENVIYEYLKQTINYLYIGKDIESKETKKIRNFIHLLLICAYRTRFSIDDKTLNVEKYTKDIIGKYKSTAIRKALSILLDLKDLLKEKKRDEIYIKKRVYLINSYNDLIPYSYRSNDFSLFDKSKAIDDEISRLTTYYYMENVLKLLLGAMYNLKNMHPLDYIINALGCTIEEIPKPKKSKVLMTEADYLYNYLESTTLEKCKITTIYKIVHSIYDKDFNLKNFQNRFIFCHGTKLENVLGILSQGLKNAPVQAVNTGKVHGSGIYLSDMFYYSLYYCYHGNRYKAGQKAIMILAEAAVGEIGKDKDTHLVKMQMNFNDVFITNEGYGIFKNSKKIKNNYGIIVVHDETNVRIKYLVEIN